MRVLGQALPSMAPESAAADYPSQDYAGDEEAAPMAAPPAAVIRRAHHDAMGVIQGESR